MSDISRDCSGIPFSAMGLGMETPRNLNRYCDLWGNFSLKDV